MKNTFEYEGKKSVMEGGGRKQDGQQGIHIWFGAPPDDMFPLYIRSVRDDKWYFNSFTRRINSFEFSIAW